MSYLSSAFKRSDIFKREFDKIFTTQQFDKPNILRYINACATVILSEAQKKYPQNDLKFINPVFIVNREIYPVPDLAGNESIINLAYESFSLVSSRAIVPLSLKVLDNRLFGLCLYFHDTIPDPDYVAFRTFNLGNTTNNNSDAINESVLVEKVAHLEMDINRVTGEFHKLAAEFDLVSTKDKMRLFRTMMLYKNMARLSEHGMFFSFVNNYNQLPSFFNCLFTFVSGKPFAEDELVDFALLIDALSAPLADYYRDDPKGVSSETMAKRSALKNMLEKSFKRVQSDGGEF